MKIKVGDKIYDTTQGPLMVILSAGDKQNIANMLPECDKYCEFQEEDFTENEILAWMNAKEKRLSMRREAQAFELDSSEVFLWMDEHGYNFEEFLDELMPDRPFSLAITTWIKGWYVAMYDAADDDDERELYAEEYQSFFGEPFVSRGEGPSADYTPLVEE